ncbi:MAG: DUF5659 domain-containing protein [Patescibacteria group bacterium]|nr:DUF5659 domain-containing protein [Patescibacteria group bacterium]
MKNQITIYDTNCAAGLITSGLKLVELDRTDPIRVGFIFSKNEMTREAINNYWSNELLVDARKFAENIKALKTRIFTEK